MQQHVFKYFPSEGYCGSLDNISIIFTDKTNINDSNKLQYYWRNTIGIIASQVLSVMDSSIDVNSLMYFMLF